MNRIMSGAESPKEVHAVDRTRIAEMAWLTMASWAMFAAHIQPEPLGPHRSLSKTRSPT
jgi:hypothetical protein